MGERDTIILRGGRPLRGSLAVQGSKNGALPVLAASYLCEGSVELTHCPDITDVGVALDILRELGCRADFADGRVLLDTRDARGVTIPDALMRRMRSSVIFLGAILGRSGRAVLSQPGGCQLGPRPIDMHLAAMERMGVRIEERGGTLYCETDGLRGAEIVLPFPSVGATENLLLAAVTARGRTRILCAACEPEIQELAGFLNACGGCIRGAGGTEIIVEGVERLQGVPWRLESDRIAAATYLTAAALTGGELELTDLPVEQLRSVLGVLESSGCRIQTGERELRLRAAAEPRALGTVRTLPYPGFPTDAQAVCMAYATISEGTSIFLETIFSERYKHCPELVRMGASIRQYDRVAVVEGVRRLHGARVQAEDLRGGAALLLAGLRAEGETRVCGAEHVRRGYEQIVRVLRGLGADIREEPEKEGLR